MHPYCSSNFYSFLFHIDDFRRNNDVLGNHQITNFSPLGLFSKPIKGSVKPALVDVDHDQVDDILLRVSTFQDANATEEPQFIQSVFAINGSLFRCHTQDLDHLQESLIYDSYSLTEIDLSTKRKFDILNILGKQYLYLNISSLFVCPD